MIVIKRDGTTRDFDSTKVKQAVEKSNLTYNEMSEQDIEKVVSIVVNKCLKVKGELTVENIQDIVEDTLLKSKFSKTAKAYILYRDERTRVRQGKTKLYKEIGRKLSATSLDNQNANVDEMSFGGRKGEASNELMKEYALNNCMSKKSKNNHLSNRIYIHDLDSYPVGMPNCLSLLIDKLMAEGANTRQADIRPANSINTFFQLLVVYFQLQSLQQFGGVSATHLDWSAVPYVRKSLLKHYIFEYLKSTEEFYNLNLEEMSDEELDNWIKEHKQTYLELFCLNEDDFYIGSKKLTTMLTLPIYRRALFETRRELKQAVEGMYHNLNTLQSRSGNQLPFTSINYGTCTLPEGRLVIRALLEGSLNGVGKLHRTPIFPCSIFQCMKGVNREPGDPNYDLFQLALKSTSKRLYPNYANVDWSNNAGYDINDPKTYFSTMGCRTANGMDINAEPGVNPQTKDGRGNVCPVTIILPTIAMEVKQKNQDVSKEELLKRFFATLNKNINDAKDMLIERFDYICSQNPASAKFVYENELMLGYKPEEGIRSALKHGTLAIGQIGIAETLQILIGKNHTTEEGMELAKKIEKLFYDKCAKFKKKYRLNFGVYYTPAENLCRTAMLKFKEKYGVIPNVSEKEYFTNSIHIPVWEKMSAFRKIDLESQLTGYSTAGCITYVELDGSIQNNLEALEKIVNYAMDKDIPYFAINVPNDTCLDCGYTGEFNDKCPVCESKNFIQLRRVTGYLTGNYKTSFNDAKIQETEDREKHSIMEEYELFRANS